MDSWVPKWMHVCQGQLVAGFKYAAHGVDTKQVRVIVLIPSPSLVQ